MSVRSAILPVALAAGLTAAAQAQPVSVAAGEGWEVLPSGKSYGELVDAVVIATKAGNMGVVTQAGPTAAAKARGVEIPGNRVIGVFRNDYAVQIMGLSTAAMIEAPVRFYVTEEPDGTATLSWKTPSHVFSPYFKEGGKELESVAAELDTVFSEIAQAAVE